MVIRELIASPQLGRLLQDAYANYVMQSALMVTQVGPQHIRRLCHVAAPLLQSLVALRVDEWQMRSELLYNGKSHCSACKM